MRMDHITDTFPRGRRSTDANCPCFAWNVMLRRLRKLRVELIAARREIKRLQAIVGG